MKLTEIQLPLLCQYIKTYLSSQDTLLLIGKLGAGKTTFTRYLLNEYGYKGPVRSPTYSLITIYPTSPQIFHADLYRLEANEEIGLEEYRQNDLCIIEWPERLPYLLKDNTAWKIYFETVDETIRDIKVLPPEQVAYLEFVP